MAETNQKQETYQAPEMERHEPVKIVQSSVDGCALYYTTLYDTYDH